MPQRNFSRIWFRISLALLIFLAMSMSLLSAKAIPEGLYLPVVLRNWPEKPAYAAAPLITEVLYDPLGEEPDSEWIELYHPGGDPLDLSGFQIGDAARAGDREGMLRFPDGTTMTSGQVIVIANRAATFFATYGLMPDFEMLSSDPDVPDMIKVSTWATRHVELTDSGDEVLLMDGNDKVVDAVSWGTSTFAFNPSIPRVAQGHSIERRPAYSDRNMASDWGDQSAPKPGSVDISTPTPTSSPTPTSTSTLTPTSTLAPTLTATPVPCGPAPLLLSEVLYDPAGVVDPAGEWFEIYNRGSVNVDLACIKVGDEETRGGGEGMLTFPAGIWLAPGKVILVANRAVIFRDQYGFDPDFEISPSDEGVPDMLKVSDWSTGSVNLSNTGDEVILMDSQDGIIDMVSWGGSTFAFDPSVKTVPEGHSIERLPASQDSDMASDWQDQPLPGPGVLTLDHATATPSSTPLNSATPTKTHSPTLVPPTPSKTATATRTPSQTPSPSLTATITPSGTQTATWTSTPTRTPTMTPTAAPTETYTQTATNTATPSSTSTGTATPSHTPTHTPALDASATPSATPSQTPASPAPPGQLLISEVFYCGNDPANEWIEVFNAGGVAVDLTNYKVGDEETPARDEGMYRFPDGSSIPGEGVIVVANKATHFVAAYGYPPDYEFVDSSPDVPNMLQYSSWASGSFSLSNQLDEVLILDGEDQIVDLVAYGSSTYPGFQPPVPLVEMDHSLERCPANVDTDTNADWIDQATPNPGSVTLVQSGWPLLGALLVLIFAVIVFPAHLVPLGSHSFHLADDHHHLASNFDDTGVV